MSTNTLNDIVASDALNTNVVQNATTKPAIIGSIDYDYVLSFFNKVMKDEVAAEKFTESLYLIANTTETSILTLVETLKGQDLLTLTTSMAFYLNGIRSPSTLLGVNNNVKPNFFAARNVLS